MNDAEDRFAARLAEDLEQVLGRGIAIDDIELSDGRDAAHVRATLLIEGRIETIEADGARMSSRSIARSMERAAEVRLGRGVLADGRAGLTRSGAGARSPLSRGRR